MQFLHCALTTDLNSVPAGLRARAKVPPPPALVLWIGRAVEFKTGSVGCIFFPLIGIQLVSIHRLAG